MITERPARSYKHSHIKTTKSFSKVLDTHVTGATLTQQLSNSRRKNRLRSEKRAAFSFRQHHNLFFSSFFAEGKPGVLFSHARKALHFAASGIFCVLGMQKHLNCKHSHNIALYRSASPVAIFDSG